MNDSNDKSTVAAGVGGVVGAAGGVGAVVAAGTGVGGTVVTTGLATVGGSLLGGLAVVAVSPIIGVTIGYFAYKKFWKK